MSYPQHLSSTVRLKMLQMLRKSGVSCNHELMQIALESMGLRLSIDQVKAEMQFLADVRCASLLNVGHLMVIDILDKGIDVAKGLSVVPGIDRHIPGAGL
jgi:hypothetical protein